MEVLVIIVWILCAFVGAKVAEGNGRSKALGFCLGLFFGIIGLLVLFLIGEKKEV